MKINPGVATLLSLAFIIEATITLGIMAYAQDVYTIPSINPQVAALLLSGIGFILAMYILYKLQ